MRKLIYNFIAILILYMPLTLQARTPLLLEQGRDNYLLGMQLEILEDPEGNLSLQEVRNPALESRWFKSTEDVPNFSFSHSVYWMRFSVKNPLDRQMDMFLELASSRQDFIDFYIADGTGVIRQTRTGDRRPFRSRRKKHRNFIFTVDLPPGQVVDIHLRIQAQDGIHSPIPLILWETDAFRSADNIVHYFLGILLGIMAVMAVYNLFLFFSLRDISYLFYVLFLFSVVFWLLMYNGFAFMFIWPDSPGWANIAIYFTNGFSMCMLLLFTRSYLETRTHAPKLDIVFKALVGLSLLIMIVALSGPHTKSVYLFLPGVFISIITSVWAAFICLMKGRRPARHYLLAFCTMFCGLILIQLRSSGVLPSNLITANGLMLGLVLGVVLLSLGLADRINGMREQKDKAREHALKIQKQAARNLEFKVEERTHDLNLANEKLKEMDRAKNRFFANLSHEFRTPLTLILAPVESILKGELGKVLTRANPVFKPIVQNGLRLLRLINNLLDFTKIEAGRMSARKQKINLVDLLKYYLSSVYSAAESKGLRIVFRDNSEGIFALLDRELMEKAIMNLLSNAFKFTPSGGEIIIQLDRGEQDYFKLSVKDSGIGVPANKLETIFNRFAQVDESTSRQHEGTGIGLSLTREIVELHGGVISVKSTLGQGTVFMLSIPGVISEEEELDESLESIPELEDQQAVDVIKSYLMADVREAQYPASEKGEETSGEAQNAVSHEHSVLMVDDNADMRSFLKILLERNYTVYMAVNGKQGLERAREHLPDLILSDVMMPEMDGYEMTQKLKSTRETRDIPVILLSAKADVIHKIEGLEFGADDYLSKPFNSDELMARIHNHIESRKLERELKQEKKERDKDFLQASLVQQTILTSQSSIEQIEELEIKLAFLPMNGLVSGDYYNISRLDGGIASIFLADATGHGTQAALSTMQIDVMYRDNIEEKFPHERFEDMNRKFVTELRSTNYFTGVSVDIFKNRINYSSAGHPEQYLIQPSRKHIQKLRTRGWMIGMTAKQRYEMQEIEFEKGDMLLLFSDGIYEVFNKSREEFGEERFFALVQEGVRNNLFIQPMNTIMEKIMLSLDEFRQEEPFGDDITLIGVRLK